MNKIHTKLASLVENNGEIEKKKQEMQSLEAAEAETLAQLG